MNYFTNLFSPETYEAYSRSDQTISGFRPRQQGMAERVQVGDRLICYMTKLSRWVGVLEVTSHWFKDDTPIFYEVEDPFIIRFKVQPLAWLEKEKTIPIHDDNIWNNLSFTQNYDKSTSNWTGKLRNSLNQLDGADGTFLEKLIMDQATQQVIYGLNPSEHEKLVTHKVRRSDKVVTVSVPMDAPVESTPLVIHCLS
jgi:predicted RNA-binding protein